MTGSLKARRGVPPPEGMTKRQWLLLWLFLNNLRKARSAELIGLDQAHLLGFLIALEIGFDQGDRLRDLVLNAADHAKADGAAERAARRMPA